MQFTLRNILTLVLVPALFLGFTAASEAGKGKKKGNKKSPEAAFNRLDTNKDSKVSKEEFAAGAKKKATAGKGAKKRDKLFARLDTNNDGALTLDEFKKLAEIKAAKKANKKKNAA